MTDSNNTPPLTFKLAQWYAFIFSSVFLLYGGVNIILAIMDHNYIDIAPPIIFVAIGLALMIPAIAYKELKIWGYYGLRLNTTGSYTYSWN